MNAMTAMWRKDARQLFWPWCTLMAASLLSFWTRWLEHSGRPQALLAEALPLGAFFGLPLLAGLALGTEFQYRTFGLTLAQPIDRRALWRQKALTSWAAIALPLLLFCLAASANQGDYDAWFIVAFATNAIVATSALMFWTLVARGIIGGLALCALTQGFVYLALLKAAEQNHNYRLMYNLPGRYSPGFIAAAAVALLGYAVTMVWLGRRSLLRYQSVEGVAASDILPTDIKLAPRWLTSSLAPRPHGAVANLVRREMYLLRPVWLLTAASVTGWIFASTFHIISPRTQNGKTSTLEFTTIALGFMLSVAIAVIAGALPIGEERNLGTHAIQMTLPLSARVQWLVKLTVATMAGAICAGILPVLVLMATGLMQGSATRFVEPEALWQVALAGACASLLAFWCACSTNATVKAILWIFPVGAVLLMAASAGMLVTETSLPVMAVDSWAVARWIFRHVDPFGLPDWFSVYWLFRTLSPVLLLAPVWLYALFQSYRIFRSDASEGNRLLRNLLPLVGLAFVIGVLPLCVEEVARAAGSQQEKIAREIHTGIEGLLTADSAKNGDGQTLRVSAQELAAATPLSEDTRRWLGSADISVVRQQGKWDGEQRCCWLYWEAVPTQAMPTQYLATIRRSGAPSCVFTYAVHTSRWYVDGRFVAYKNGNVRGNCRQ